MSLSKIYLLVFDVLENVVVDGGEEVLEFLSRQEVLDVVAELLDWVDYVVWDLVVDKLLVGVLSDFVDWKSADLL